MAKRDLFTTAQYLAPELMSVGEEEAYILFKYIHKPMNITGNISVITNSFNGYDTRIY